MGKDQFFTLESYEAFLRQTRVKINKMLNKVLWICIVTGPALAFGAWTGMFPRVQYITCLWIAILMALLALGHRLLTEKFPDSKVTSYFALIALDFLLVYMANSHINIALTYYIVPLVALLFCDKRLYLQASAFNFVVMLGSVWNISEYYAATTVMDETPLQWYLNLVGGYVIESVIMVSTGYVVCKYMTVYFSNFYRNKEELLEKEAKISEQFAILSSMTEIYQSINLVDLETQTSTFFGQNHEDLEVLNWSKQMRTKLNEDLSRQVMLDQYDNFLRFTNLATLKERLGQKKSVSSEFISTIQGWFRAQYIVVSRDENGVPTKVIYTIQNIDEDKKREERLIRISNTDELTRVFNRRSYENDIRPFRRGMVDPNLVLVSADVNGLKKVNDTLGHEAGDEIIRATANCLVSTMGNIGKVYRVGGDEFMVIAYVRNGNFEDVKNKFLEQVSAWTGKLVDSLSVSIGYVCKKDYPDSDIDALEKTVDGLMYQMKQKFYSEGETLFREPNTL